MSKINSAEQWESRAKVLMQNFPQKLDGLSKKELRKMLILAIQHPFVPDDTEKMLKTQKEKELFKNIMDIEEAKITATLTHILEGNMNADKEPIVTEKIKKETEDFKAEVKKTIDCTGTGCNGNCTTCSRG
jgi:hypothetical protein